VAYKKADPGRLAALSKLADPKASAEDEEQPDLEMGDQGNEGDESAPPDAEGGEADASAPEGAGDGSVEQALSAEQDPEGIMHLKKAQDYLTKAHDILQSFYDEEGSETPQDEASEDGGDDTAHGDNQERSQEA
jgi:hypothetical protein